MADSAPHAETAHPGDAPMPGMPRISIKYFVLLLLTLQNVGAVLMMRLCGVVALLELSPRQLKLLVAADG